MLVAAGFLASVYCSVETLRYGDVAWYMMLHYIQPLGVWMLDWLWLNHKPPTFYSILSLLIVITSSVWWMWYRTGHFHPVQAEGVAWGTAWVLVMVVYLTFLKHVVVEYPTVSLDTPMVLAGWSSSKAATVYSFLSALLHPVACVGRK